MKKILFATMIALSALNLAPMASADSVTDGARVAGVIGEQADGYLGIVGGQTVSAQVQAHMDQVNIGRRAAYTQRATARGVSINEMAAAVACELFSGHVALNEHYRDENGAWRQRTASAPVVMPSFCPR